jgi:hypothetical protein
LKQVKESALTTEDTEDTEEGLNFLLTSIASATTVVFAR